MIRNGNNNLVLFEGSKAGKLYSFTTGGDLLMGRNIIRRWGHCAVLMRALLYNLTVNVFRHEKYNRIAESERLYLVNIYRTQHYIHHLNKELNVPVVSLMNGTVMGSGAMFGLNSTWSVATERSVWALPEVTIAGMPDVGALYHMARLEDHLGTMLALSGYRLSASGLLHAGLASHFCRSDTLPGLKKDLLFNGEDNEAVKQILDEYHQASDNDTKVKDSIAQLRFKSKQAYNSKDVREIIHNLKVMNDDWSKNQLSLLSKACPLSLR